MINVRFYGTRGTSFQSDMAIDDVDVSDPLAPVAVTTNAAPPVPLMDTYQRNTQCAASDINGVQSNGLTPAITRLAVGGPATFNFSATPGLPYDVLITAGALIPAGAPGSFTTGAGQTVNAPFLSPFQFWLNSGTATANFLTQGGSLSFPFVLSTPALASTQSVIIDPSSADGLRLSQGTEIRASLCPPGLDRALTDNSISFQPLGYPFTYYGTSYSQVFISSNGLVHFGMPNYGFVTNAAGMRSVTQPTISVWSEDFDPGTGGTVEFCSDAVQNFYVNWNGVPSANAPNGSTFSLAATSNPAGGACVMSWDPGAQETEGTIGLTPGSNQFPVLIATDLSTIPGAGLIINPGEIIVEEFTAPTSPFDLLGQTLTWSLDPNGFPITIL